MTQLFEAVSVLENPTLEIRHSLKMARGFIEVMAAQAADGFSIDADDFETAEFALDELASKYEVLAGAVALALAQSRGKTL